MATSDLLKLANLLPLSNACSEVWKFYGFKNDEGKIVDGDKVSSYKILVNKSIYYHVCFTGVLCNL